MNARNIPTTTSDTGSLIISPLTNINFNVGILAADVTTTRGSSPMKKVGVVAEVVVVMMRG